MSRPFAAPGDADLDVDVDGLHLTSVLRLDHDFIVKASGGIGWWKSADGTSHEVQNVEDFDLFWNCVPTPGYEWISDDIDARLNRWLKEAMPFRCLGSPTKAFLLIADRDDGIVVPRTRCVR